jgi:Flp pilus assembly protein CpaB
VRRTSRLVLVLGFFLAAIVAVVIIAGFGRPATTPGDGSAGASAPPVQLPAVFALQEIPLGTVVTADMLVVKTIPVNTRYPTAFGNINDVLGKVNRRELAADSQLQTGDFQNRPIPLAVPQGKVAITVQMSELTGVANLLDAGDSVDLVISLRGDAFPVVQVLNDGSITVVPGINPLSVKLPLLLQDIQILAVLDAPNPAPATAANGQPLPSQAPAITNLPKLLILAVTPAQAEVLVFARTTGTLDALLRSPLDAGLTAQTTGVILKTLVDKYGILPPEIVQVPIPTPLKK